MTDDLRVFRRVVVLAHPKLPEAIEEAAQVAAFLNQHGLPAEHGALGDERLRQKVISGAFDLIIALGGDGTMLRVGHLGGPHNIPILGTTWEDSVFLTEMKENAVA